MTAARHNADHLAHKGLVAPVRFVGYTDPNRDPGNAPTDLGEAEAALRKAPTR